MINSREISPLKIFILMINLRLNRIVNWLVVMGLKSLDKKLDKKATKSDNKIDQNSNDEKDIASTRKATGRKNSVSPIRAVGLIILFTIFLVPTFKFNLDIIQETLNKRPSPLAGKKNLTATAPEVKDLIQTPENAYRSKPFINNLSFLIAGWFFAIYFISIGYQNKDLSKMDTDVEWFMTLPVSVPMIYLGKIVERTFVNLGWVVFPSVYGAVFWYWGYRWSLPFLLIAITLPITFVLAFLQFSLEIVCKKFFSVTIINNLQAIATVIGMLLMTTMGNYMMLMLGTSLETHYVLESIGAKAIYLPCALGLSISKGATFSFEYGRLIIHLSEIIIITVSAWSLISWASNRGLEAIQASDRERNIKFQWRKTIFSGILNKDLTMLSRDKTLITQMFVSVVGLIPIFFIPGISKTILTNPLYWGAFAFSAGVFALINTATGVLVHEGDALWMLFTFPTALKEIVKKKLRIWLTIGCILSFIFWSIGIIYRGKFVREDLLTISWIIVGMPIITMIAGSLGLLGTDPFEVEKSKRVRQDLVISVMLMGLMFVGSMFIPGIWGKVYSIFLFSMLAYALWQKAVSRIDYILDPNALPPPQIHLADGFSALIYFVVFLVLFTILISFVPIFHGVTVFLIAYLLAVLMSGFLIFSLLRNEGIKLREAMPFVQYDTGQIRAMIIIALQGSLIAVSLALVISYFSPKLDAGMINKANLSEWEVGLAYILSPLITLILQPFFEEIVFRGMVFTGLKRSFGSLPAMITSSLFFALLQPNKVVLFYLLIGIVLAWSYERARVITVPIFIHFIFNAVIFAMQLLSSYQGIGR